MRHLLNQEKEREINKKKYSMSTDQFKEIFWKEGKEYFARGDRNFIVDSENKGFLDLICNYFTNDPLFEKKCKGELRKGLLIYGPCGTGKSSIFDIVQIISKKYNLKNLWFSNISVHDLVTQYSLEGEYLVERYRKGKVHFDDLGTERIANSWGVKEKLMSRIVELRYNEFKQKGTKTFITTNLTIKDLNKFYGNGFDDSRNRFADRLYEMFNFIPLGGSSRRF
ncbi:hypothetical protein [Leeuwenhoekiella marinoflava]|uniref:hypothetical protein n=1 Tax=Leeuwenhoekiella marinoflava TaxID=988 RepID=UPI0030018298